MKNKNKFLCEVLILRDRLRRIIKNSRPSKSRKMAKEMLEETDGLLEYEKRKRKRYLIK